MALKDFVFNLSDVSVSAADNIDTGSAVSVNGAEVGKLGAAQSYLDMGSFGKITAVDANTVDVKIAAGVESGVYDITQGAKAKVRNFDASAVTAGMNVDLSVVSVDSGVVKTGFGDDVISVSGSSAKGVNVYGGKGADVFVLTSDANEAVVQDYSYAQGDVVSVSGLSAYKLTNTGEFYDSPTGSTTVKAAGADGLYKVKLQDGSNENKTYDVITAQAGEDVSVTLSQDAGIVDVSGAKSAVVDLGQGNDTITAANTALTLKVGRADGTANELKQVLDKDDTLALLNGDLGIVAVKGNGELTFGDTTIKSAVNASGQSEFKVSFDDGKTTGVAAAGTDKITVEAGDQPDFYVGIGASTKVSVKTATTVDAVIDLSDNSKISGNVNFIDATNVNGNATLKGRADVATTIKTGAVATGKTQEIYTGTGKDSVGLASSAGVFKVHLSNAKGNADTVTSFTLANDILVLDDVAKLAVDTFSVTGSDLLLGTSKASIAGAATAGNEKNVQVQLSGADKAIKVALAKSSSIIAADQDTDVVLNVNDTVPAGVSYKGATFANAFEVNLNATDKYIGTFVSVDASDAGQAALVLGKDGVDNHVTVDGGSVVWGGANSNDSLTINRDDVNGGSIVWTGATGGKDTLTGYEGDKIDVIYSYDRATWTNEAIKSDVTFDSDDDVIINSADGSTLKVNGTSAGGNLLLMGTQMEVSKVAIANSGTSVAAYASDVNVYLSAAANTTVDVNNSAVAEGDSAVIDLSANNLMGAGKTYGDNITNIDASKSAGSFLLVGANVSGSTIKGGQTMNVLYGGGKADQTMTGVGAAADLFWFGSTDGHDIINNFDAKRDVVYLWNTTDIKDVKVAVNAAGDSAAVVFEATGSTLDINGANIANATFMVRDGADGYNYYTYDAKNKAFVKKQ